MNPDNTHQHLRGLDHLRALAITMVFFCHYNLDIFGHPKWIGYVRFGWSGVDLFFVLSGFLISSQLFASIKAGRGVNYRTFFLKRFFRIIPAFCAVTALYYLIPQFREEPTLPPLSRLLTFTHNLGLNVYQYGAFSHTWSLCVEEHFYFALPLVLILLNRLNLLKVGPWMIAILVVGGFAIRELCYRYQYLPMGANANSADWYRYIYYPTYCRLDGLLMGVSIAATSVFAPEIWKRMQQYGNVFLLTSICLLGIAAFTCSDPSYRMGTFGFPLIGTAYGALVVASLSPNTFLYKWRSNITTFIATLSYGIYLLHKGAIHIAQLALAQAGLDTNSVLVMLLCIVSCVLFASALYLVVEQPFMRVRDHILYGKRKKRVEPAMN